MWKGVVSNDVNQTDKSSDNSTKFGIARGVMGGRGSTRAAWIRIEQIAVAALAVGVDRRQQMSVDASIL